MANVKIQSGMPTNFNWQQFFLGGDPTDTNNYDPSNANASTFVYTAHTSEGDFTVTLTSASGNFKYGTSPYYDGGALTVPTGGTITAIQVANGSNALQITGLSFGLDEFFKLAFDFDDPFTGNHENGNSWDTVSALLAGNDKFSFDFIPDPDDNYQIQTGENAGNDKVIGATNHDWFDASQGKDKYLGGAGKDDGLSYSWSSFFNDAAFRGVKLDAKKGVAIDPWGDKDKFSKIENFDGSKFDDVLKGSGKDEWFYGRQGKDKIDGRGGFDSVSYQNDIDFPGGGHGIVAKLANKGYGKIVDGYGDTDKVKNVEMIMATNFDDKMVGNKKDNSFQGLAGDDNINGKGGEDWIVFWKNKDYGGGGVVVDLGAGTVSDDGLGGVDSLKSIESVYGSDFNDMITGSGKDNRLEGQNGEDTLDGKAGHDELHGGNDADTFVFSAAIIDANSDVVEDFDSGQGDTIALSLSVFTMLTGPGDLAAGEFIDAADAADGDDYIVYDSANGDLYYDADGNGAGGKTLIAHFNNNPAITAGDIDVIA